ncbi:ABC transporter ATP-binding protein [Streptomyces gobiensis]|uniref:ABC transporter ATP-binding protein n=1 Tax=Streptomyces gobiensis TaxID=2875706 RepID=UPI001E5D02EC|nr:ABC transporter ATP-binding protein [Streptomyces gobiensis]UGY94124.1 ABC transporter ATP-binding protein [Streptomyces gobiensis]
MRNTTPLLRLTGLHSGYGPVPVVHDVSLTVHQGEICALVGANGAGKSTLLSTVSGLLKPTAGTVAFNGADLTGARAETISARGLIQIPEGRRVFRGLTVRENLDLGLWQRKLTATEERERLDWVLSLFPFLAQRLGARAEVLSGGEQQMMVIGQALMGQPRMLLIDEPSIGLAPVVIDRVFATLRELRDQGLTLLLVDQVVERTLELADRAFIMQAGRIIADGPAAQLRDGPQLRQAYLGTLATTD